MKIIPFCGEQPPKTVEEVIDCICEKYCKFPEQMLSIHKDPDDANKALNDICANCPLNFLIDK